jgi:hypothetical protein
MGDSSLRVDQLRVTMMPWGLGIVSKTIAPTVTTSRKILIEEKFETAKKMLRMVLSTG